MTETITQFAMGEAVPEWLITVEPMHPGSHKQNFRFAVDVDVIETPDVFVVVPRMFGNFLAIIDMSGTHGCHMFAPGKPTRIATGLADIFAPGVTPMVEIGVAVPPPSPAVDNAYVEAVVDPHQTFWARLKYAFLGR